MVQYGSAASSSPVLPLCYSYCSWLLSAPLSADIPRSRRHGRPATHRSRAMPGRWTLRLLTLAPATLAPAALALAPTWPPTFDMALSTTVMPCNNAELMSSGPNWPTIRGYGLIDIDWSNAKQKWINTSPMTCEEDLLKQAQLIKANNTLGKRQKVWIYRNAVWGMPWMTHTRKLLDDPAYDVWFLRFKNGSDGRGPLYHDGDGTYKSSVCDHNFSPPKCSELYHGAQFQTPGFPHGDGNCVKPCDCGRVPCGPYLFGTPRTPRMAFQQQVAI